MSAPDTDRPQAIVIEDLKLVRDKIRKQLEDLNFTVIAVESLRKPLDVQMLRKAPYVVVVTDLVDSARAANRRSIDEIARKDIQARLEGLKRLRHALAPTPLCIYVYSKAPSVLAELEDQEEEKTLDDLIKKLTTDVGVEEDRIIGKWGPPKRLMPESLEALKDKISVDVAQLKAEHEASTSADADPPRGPGE